MKIMKRLSVLAILLFAASLAHAQATVTGEVVEIVNGKSVILMLPAGKMLVELQYIEVPEAEQPLHGIVTSHLKTLVLGRRAQYKAIRMLKNGGTVGRLVIDGADVSQQMLRDGAAWHVPSENTGQNKAQADEYAASERSARDEKRGVWSIAGMKTAWDFRADRAAAIAAANAAKSEEKKAAIVSARSKSKSVWSDANPSLAGVGAFATGYNEATKTGFISTTPLGVTTDGTLLPKGTVAAIEITYLYKQESPKQRKGTFVVTLTSRGDEWSFLKENSLDVVVDEKIIKIGTPKREESRKDGFYSEKLTYYIDRSVVERMANADLAFLKIGKNLFKPTPGWQLLVYNLAQVSK